MTTMDPLRVKAQLNAARLPGEQCEYTVGVPHRGHYYTSSGEQHDERTVYLTVVFRGVLHAMAIWCEQGLRYAEDGGLEPQLVARTHSNTKFRLTKRLEKQYRSARAQTTESKR